MRDLRVVSAKAVLKIDAIGPIRDFWPPSILITGPELQQTTEIELNGILVSEFIIQDSRHVVARIPESQVGQPVSSIHAYTPVSASYSSAAVEFAVGRPFRAITGIDRLVQAWLILFFSTPGSDIFSKNSGGGARHLIGKATDAGHEGAAADLALCIDRTKNELMRLQSEVPGLPLSERLMSSSLSDVYFEPSTSILYATVTLDSMAGNTAQLALG